MRNASDAAQGGGIPDLHLSTIKGQNIVLAQRTKHTMDMYGCEPTAIRDLLNGERQSKSMILSDPKLLQALM